MAADPVARLAASRAERTALEARRTALRAEMRAAEEDVADLQRTGAPRAAQRAAQQRSDRLRRDHDRVTANEERVRTRIDDLHIQLLGNGPERSLDRLAGGVPVTLLPVRLETRFGDQGTSLRIRIFPEQIHVDQHEPALTADELVVARRYWEARWAAGADVDARRAAWAALARVVRPARARWLVAATTPSNIEQLGQGTPTFPDPPMKAAPWTRAPLARLLPEQFVAMGFRGGVEMFRVWATPVAETVAMGLAPDLDHADDAGLPPAEQTTLPIDDGMRWMVDYDEAVAIGLAMTVTDANLTSGTLAAGLDEVVVVGVDSSLLPENAALALADHLAAHAVSDGFALLGAGTPTNNTSEDRAAPGTDPLLDPEQLDPAESDPAVQAEGARLATAMGLAHDSAFATVPGHGRFDDGPPADMATALWAPTLGYFFDQMLRPVVPSNIADAAAAHFRRFVRGRGPFGTLRIGRQPYGVLPVVAGTFTSDDSFERGLAGRLAGLRPFWANATSRVPRLGDSDRPDADLVDLLRRTPRSATFRLREAAGASYTTSLFGFNLTAIFQEQLARMTLTLAGIDPAAEIATVTVRPDHRRVPVPLVGSEPLSETAPPEPNLVAGVHADTIRTGGFRRMLDDPAAASSLLEALLRQAALLEYAIGSTQLVVAHELATNVLTQRPVVTAVFEREVFGIGGALDSHVLAGTGDAPPDSLLTKVEGVVELATTRVTAVSGNRNLVDFLAVSPNEQLSLTVETKRFADFRASLSRLAQVPAAELGRLAADTLDCASHRLDAWITSLATRRLDEVRTANVAGCHLGAFGYVEDLAPRAAPASLGYLQAPSVAHATTAAILRSGHLARRGDADSVLALDLASTRVALALELIEGVRRGQPIGALLGYRFERGLRDRRLTLAQYILPLRQLAPLAQSTAGPDDGTPIEVLAARDVVDGVVLLQRWKADPNALFAAVTPAPSPADRADLEAELQRLDDALDAVSDLLVAESVHQAVLGNAERAAAALDALDRQTTVPDVDIVRTPRTGTGAHHRLALLLQTATAAPGWEQLTDPRRTAEPRVDAWAGTVLGDPARYRFAADVVDAAGAVVQKVAAKLPDLGMSAVATVAACAAGGQGGITELEERVAAALSAAVTAPAADHLVLLDDPPAQSPASSLGLRDLLDLGEQILELLAGGRLADARSLASETDRPAAGIDVAELRARADAAVAALKAAADSIVALPANASAERLAAALAALTDAGQRYAWPAEQDPLALAARAATALTSARAALQALADAEAAIDRATAEPAAQVAHDLARLRAVFGAGFPVAPIFTATNGAELTASTADTALLDGDPLSPVPWLVQHAHVRPAAARLAGVLSAAELLGGAVGLEALTVAQLPHQIGARWIGLRRDPTSPRPAATTSIVAHVAATVDLTSPLAGFVLDQWADVIPNDHETTGTSFHFDAPGARAPQSILLAVPGNRAAPAWTVEALAGTVREAMALARIRALDIDDVDAVARFLPAIYLPFNLESKTPSLNLSAIINRAILSSNAVFLAGGST